MNMTRSTALDELTLTVVVDNETDALSSVDAGVPQLPEIASHVLRRPPVRTQDGHDCVTVFDKVLVEPNPFSAVPGPAS